MVSLTFLSYSLLLGPNFGSQPSFIRKKLLAVLDEYRKASSIIDDISIVKRYASELSNALPVSSDDEALSKARKEVYVAFGVFCGRGWELF